MGLVHISLVAVHQPVLTGPIEDQLGPVVVGSNISELVFQYKKYSMLCVRY